MNPTKQASAVTNENTSADRRETVTITDNRTGKQYEVPINNETIRAIDLRQIKVHDADFGMMSYDPAFTNTASCTSQITFIDGDKGILRYRGYAIEELAEKSTYLETAYLLLHGELPTKDAAARIGRTTSRTTRSFTKASRNSWTGFTTMPIPWA